MARIEQAFDMGVKRYAPGDRTSDWIDDLGHREKKRQQSHALDGAKAKDIHRRLLSWFFHERARQAENRMQMAIDADFYDNEQWDAEDAEVLRSRGQVPLVFNEVAPMADWVIGTERRTRVDWRVLPRTEDDVQPADAKSKVLKYVADVNHTQYHRSRAFADCVKAGIGWLDDGARDDPTQDILYSLYEDWRNVLWDSAAYSLDGTDWRYQFRWRWVDDDIAEAMFPDRAAQIRRSVVDAGVSGEGTLDQDWYLGERIQRGGSDFASGDGVYGDASRPRIRLIECQFRMPVRAQMVADGPLKGAFLGPHDYALQEAVSSQGSRIIDRVVMRTHVAVFTEADMLSLGPSIYRHNRYSLTALWCYRRGRDRMPYGVIRRVRDIQQDLNKRASKALFLLSTNQIIATENAVADKTVAREEADMPDGYIEVKKGEEFKLQRDADQATAQIQLMTLDAQTIQRSAGVNNENLGRQTNAVSGEAIKARQLQGSVATTEIFDNLRFAVQTQGEKMLSLVEQFYTEEKVIRLTGARGKLDWLRINKPEIQADGSVRYLNDITASAADFVVSEADYAGTFRQVMFDGITGLAQRLAPEVALRLFIIAMEFSDLPNKDDIADAMRRIIGERDPSKTMTPEEAQQAEQQMAAQAEALQIQRETALLTLEEQRAKVREINAKADALLAKQGEDSGDAEAAIRQVQERAAQEIERLSDALRKAQMEAAREIMTLRADKDAVTQAARIKADAEVRVAEIRAASDEKIRSLEERMAELAKEVGEVKRATDAPDSGGEQ